MKRNKKGKIKTGKLALFLLIVAAVLVILGMAVGKGVTYIMGKNGNSASPISYYLFIGTDKNWGNEADALLLTAWNSRDKEVTFISIPPNTKLSRQEKKNQLIRSTFSEGGAEETKSAVENLLHLRVDGYGVVDFSDFENYMDKIGGIDMYVEKNMEHVDGSGNPDITIRQGYQDLKGAQALGYVRYLDGKNGEIDRMPHPAAGTGPEDPGLFPPQPFCPLQLCLCPPHLEPFRNGYLRRRSGPAGLYIH